MASVHPLLTLDNARPRSVLHERGPHVRWNTARHPGHSQRRSRWVLRHRPERREPVTIWNTSCQVCPNPDTQPSSERLRHLHWIFGGSSDQVDVISGYSKGAGVETPESLTCHFMGLASKGQWGRRMRTETRVSVFMSSSPKVVDGLVESLRCSR